MIKKYIKDGYEYTEYYKSWWDELVEGYQLSLYFLFCGLIGVFLTPIIAIYAIWRPQYRGGGRRKIVPCDLCGGVGYSSDVGGDTACPKCYGKT